MFKSDRSGLRTLAMAALLVSASAAHATVSPEQRCASGLASAAAKYASCTQKAVAKFFLFVSFIEYPAYESASAKCATKYTATWPKLLARGCYDPRFVDLGTTVIDSLTGLEWEKKTEDATVHDKNNDYTWSASGFAADGTVFTSFLASLNSGGCFNGQCDWRLPTRDELLTIASPAYPACTTGPCIDPLFGPTVAAGYWSATGFALDYFRAWFVYFNGSTADVASKFNNFCVRGVRSGGL